MLSLHRYIKSIAIDIQDLDERPHLMSIDTPLEHIVTELTAMQLYKDFKFEAAHFLPNVPDDHKCKRLHGHSFHVRVHIKGPLNPQSGWVMDYSDIKQHVKPIIDSLDHYLLNDIDGLENPTSEHLCKWIWDKLYASLPLLHCIEVKETCTSGCLYFGEE
jgi:6-pyruvoyltetrahydropterin/6-carboxytetrahydropterin synthase